jgi:uncharacterized BrkB/YihY/UPF0761 family membrane protein
MWLSASLAFYTALSLAPLLSLAMVFTVAFLLLPQHKSDAMVHSSPGSGVSNEIG